MFPSFFQKGLWDHYLYGTYYMFQCSKTNKQINQKNNNNKNPGRLNLFKRKKGVHKALKSVSAFQEDTY